GMTLNDATQLAKQEERFSRRRFSLDQEKALVADLKLLGLFYLVATHVDFDGILKRFDYERSELIKYLVRLDRLKIIDLLPNQRIKLRLPLDAKWNDHGPLMKKYGNEMKADFVNYQFDKQGELFDFYTGYVSEETLKLVQNALAKVFVDFHQMSDVDAASAKRARRMTFLVACRPWTFSIISQLARSNKV
ncbi:MAG: hypothetical protein ABL958_10220, partial [Bdellovibrionia bacterium]